MTVQRSGETAGDYDGLEACWREFHPRLLLLARARRADDPEEAVQNVFLQLVRRWDKLDRTRPMWPLLCAMLRDVLVDEWRRNRCRPGNLTGDVQYLENALDSAARPTTGISEPEQAAISATRDRIVRVTVAAMPPDERSVLYGKTGVSLPDLPGQDGAVDRWVMRRKGPSVMRHMRCALKDLRGLLAAVGCGALLPRWWAKLHGPTTAAVGGAAVTAALVLGGAPPWWDDPDPARPPAQEAEAAPPTMPIAPSRSSRVHGDQVPRKDSAKRRTTARTEPPPAADGDPEPPPPLRHSLHVDPDTGPGEKERDDTQADTGLGTLTVGGDAYATGPIAEPPCLAGTCSRTSQAGINGP